MTVYSKGKIANFIKSTEDASTRRVRIHLQCGCIVYVYLTVKHHNTFKTTGTGISNHCKDHGKTGSDSSCPLSYYPWKQVESDLFDEAIKFIKDEHK